MYYFVNQYLLERNSGVEHNEFSRIRLFQDHGVPAAIVTRDYHHLLHHFAATFGIEDDQLVNAYDFFQGTRRVATKALGVADLPLPHQYQIHHDPTTTTVYNGDTLLAQVDLIPGLVDHVGQVTTFDARGNRLQTTLYDSRGFKSMDQFYNETGQVVSEVGYRLDDGTRAFERYYEFDPQAQVNRLVLIRLRDYQRQDWDFPNDDAFMTFFLDELNRSTGGENVFVADRPGAVMVPVAQMRTPTKKLLSLPMVHTTMLSDPIKAPWEGIIAPEMSHGLPHFDGVLVMTNAQQADIQRKLGTIARPVYPVAGAFQRLVPQAQRVPITERDAGSIIVVGHLSPRQRIKELVQAFGASLSVLPKEARLDFYGYGDAAYVKEVEALIAELNLTERVHLRGYLADLSAVYDRAQLLINMTAGDAFPLAIVEAQQHGVPVLANRANYGPAAVIQDGVNGRLIKNGQTSALKHQLKQYFGRPDQMQQLSHHAYENPAVTADVVWGQWQKVQAAIQK